MILIINNRRKNIINRKMIYLCGGMGKFGKERFSEANEWRIDINNKIRDASNGKISCCNPNDHFNFLDDKEYSSQREVMEYDLYRVRNSDVIVVNFNDPNSIGSACEMAIAYYKRIPIIGLCEYGENNNLHPWLKCMCNRIFVDREKLILYIVKHYI